MITLNNQNTAYAFLADNPENVNNFIHAIKHIFSFCKKSGNILTLNINNLVYDLVSSDKKAAKDLDDIFLYIHEVEKSFFEYEEECQEEGDEFSIHFNPNSKERVISEKVAPRIYTSQELYEKNKNIISFVIDGNLYADNRSYYKEGLNVREKSFVDFSINGIVTVYETLSYNNNSCYDPLCTCGGDWEDINSPYTFSWEKVLEDLEKIG